YKQEISTSKTELKAAVVGIKSQELAGQSAGWNFSGSSLEQPENVFRGKNGGVSTTWLQILNFLRTYKKEQSELASTIETYEARIQEKEQVAERLTAQKEQLRLQLDQLNEQYQSVRDEYYSLLTIVDRARRISEENMT
ncbi:MAG: hypothetical protein JWN30_301, partial [Bacilli bacterium]|nr:hypothetical protein [Bacilli bacterium]